MASENNKNWDLPIASSNASLEGGEEEEEITPEERRQQKNLERLKKYVAKMAYKPVMPLPDRKPNRLTDPKKHILKGTYDDFQHVLSPKERAIRVKRNVDAFTSAISTEQLEEIIKKQKSNDKKKESLSKRKQVLYYEMLAKLEHQCRSQYLNVLIKKFSNFIAKLATTMRSPPQLTETYARMQRGIFCNILLAIGVQPTNQSSIYYCTEEAREYEVCHKLAHAFLSLIIKALDSAAIKNSSELQPTVSDFEMENYIKDRLMCAAEKKLTNKRPKQTPIDNKVTGIIKTCDYTDYNR